MPIQLVLQQSCKQFARRVFVDRFTVPLPDWFVRLTQKQLVGENAMTRVHESCSLNHAQIGIQGRFDSNFFRPASPFP